MRKYLLTAAFLLSSIFVFAQKDLIVSSGEEGFFINHKVAPKESFYSIGRIYSIHPKEIAEENNLDMTKGLAIGQNLRIPLGANLTQTTDKGTPVYYVVGEKEGLYRVSVKNNNVLMANLRKWNKLTSDNIKPGQKLIIGYIIPAEQMVAEAPVSDLPQEKRPEGEDLIQEVKLDIKTAKEEVKKEQAKEVKEKDPVVTEPRPVQVNRAASNDGTGGYFRTAFEHQARSASINKEQTATSGIFKTSSGWDDAKYYILIDKVEPGTIVKITNPSNNKSVYAKVLEGMSGIRQNAGLDVRISNAAASILDVTETDKFIVKVAY